jgi:hypothetical protein
VTDLDEAAVEEEDIRVVQCYTLRRALPFYRACWSDGVSVFIHIKTKFCIFIFRSKCVN